MNNQIAIGLGLLILALLGLDYYFYGSEGILFLLRKQDDLIEWLAFWR